MPLQRNPSAGYCLASKDAISAINRATSELCKKKIAELACQSVDAPDGIGDLYPRRLPNFCHSATNTVPNLVGKYLGKVFLLTVITEPM